MWNEGGSAHGKRNLTAAAAAAAAAVTVENIPEKGFPEQDARRAGCDVA